MKKIFIIQWLMLISLLTVVAQGNDSIPALPYTATFSTSEGWVLNNGAALNYWILGTSGSNNALLVTNNGSTPPIPTPGVMLLPKRHLWSGMRTRLLSLSI